MNTNEDQIHEHRKNIDLLDEKIIELLAKRQQEVQEIGALKKEEQLPVYDPKRELDQRTKRRKLARELKLDPLRLDVIFEQIINLSRVTQKNMQSIDLSAKGTLRVGVMGGIGSFSEEAALFFMKKHDLRQYELSYPISAENVLKSLDEEQIDVGIFPIENSTAGIVEESIYAASHYQFDIQEIFEIDVRHCLHVLPGVKKEEITKIMSHPQALRQCKGYLQKNFPQAELIEATDTAEGARILEQSPEERNLAVIAPKRAGEIYHLQTLEEGIQDLKENYTRFIAAKK
jgi:chorismate mutase